MKKMISSKKKAGSMSVFRRLSLGATITGAISGIIMLVCFILTITEAQSRAAQIFAQLGPVAVLIPFLATAVLLIAQLTEQVHYGDVMSGLTKRNYIIIGTVLLGVGTLLVVLTSGSAALAVLGLVPSRRAKILIVIATWTGLIAAIIAIAHAAINAVLTIKSK